MYVPKQDIIHFFHEMNAEDFELAVIKERDIFKEREEQIAY